MTLSDNDNSVMSLEFLIGAGNTFASLQVSNFLEIEHENPSYSASFDCERAVLIDVLLQIGHLKEARSLVHRWLLGYRESLSINPCRRLVRREYLWRCLADVVERTSDHQLLEIFWNCLDGIKPQEFDLANPILPLLGVPILNRFDLLERLLTSLDYPVDVLAIVDNSHRSDRLSDQIVDLQSRGHPLINRIEVATPFANLGVAGSWNHILKSFPDSHLALLVNNDICFAPGILRKALAKVPNDVAFFMPLLPVPNSFSAFLLNYRTWDSIGLFDENFYPAYCEDVAYSEAIFSHPELNHIQCADIQFSMQQCNPFGSYTINSDPHLAVFNRMSFQLNRLWLLSRRRSRGELRGTWLRRWLCQWSE
jgi:hypothetical protein